MDAAAVLHLPLDYVSDSLVVKQASANKFDLTPVWAPAEPPAKRAKTAEVRLSSTGDVRMTPRNEDNAQGSSDDSHPPWEQRPGVTPVGAPGTTPLRPPWIPADPNEHRDI